MSKDKLEEMFFLRETFMRKIRVKDPEISPDWPVNLSDKKSQQHIRDMALRGVEEMFEALQHLKNWKPHRSTQVTEFNRDEFLEEIVDAFNYFFSVLILVGVSEEDLFQAYKKKDKVIRERVESGY
ncbi:MAG: hypothetical protein CML56_08110 [Rhodobacteraceae bacterium]|nr:hypothetical protein [Paracoccaceae bacterium]